jgi:lipopolysaccharide export system protein LptA
MRAHVFLLLLTVFCVESLSRKGPRGPLGSFSKITVTSQTALFKKDKKNSSIVHLKYSKNVHVTLDDGSTVDTDNLDVFVNTKTNGIEKIIFSDKVFVRRGNKKLWADRAELLVVEKLCKLNGHVRVEQLRDEKNDIPVTTECEQAIISWESDEIELSGSAMEPVSTIIKLEGRLRSLSRKNKEKKREKHHKNLVRSGGKKSCGRRSC